MGLASRGNALTGGVIGKQSVDLADTILRVAIGGDMLPGDKYFRKVALAVRQQ
jgi:hypothetical protein